MTVIGDWSLVIRSDLPMSSRVTNHVYESRITNHQSRYFMSDWIPVAAAGEFPPGTHRVVDVDGAQIAVFNVNGQYYAIEDVCTHDGGILTGGPVENDEVICPRHGA